MNKQHFRVTLLLWLVLSLTIMQILRIWTIIAWMNVLAEFNAQPGLAVSLAGSAGFTIIGCALVWGIWQRKFWTAKLVACSGIGYTIWYWGERLLWQEPHSNLPFVVLLNLVLLLFTHSTAIYLAKEAHER